MKTLRVAVVQTSAGTDVSRNLADMEHLIGKSGPYDLIALPEVFGLRGSNEDYRQGAQPIPGPMTARLAKLASQHGAWVCGGSVIERRRNRTFNTSVLISPQGAVAATYRKIHLFEAHLDDGKVVRESEAYDPGDKPVITEIAGWRCGMSICYDIRFPELYRLYSRKGVDLFLVPANFTQNTGRDHWEVLLRSRAIENQCFVVAPDQCGTNPRTGVESYGHSMVVAPWGDVLCRAGSEVTVLTAELDPTELDRTRRRIPVLEHRRL